MQCNFYQEESLKAGPAWLERNRVTYSKVTECNVRDYWTPTYSIKYPLVGMEHYQLNGKNYPAGRGKFLVVNKGRPIDYVFKTNKPVEGLCIHLEKQLLEDVYVNGLKSDAWLLEHPAETVSIPDFEELLYSQEECELGKYLQHMAALFDRKTKSIDIEENELFQQVAYYLLRLQHSMPAPGCSLDVIKSSTRSELIRRLANARELINEQAPVMPDMHVIAKKALLSPAHFYRNFKKAYGMTPYQYAINRKMELAASALRKGNRSITEIAFDNGFADLSAFSKAFRKFYGYPPGEERRAKNLEP